MSRKRYATLFLLLSFVVMFAMIGCSSSTREAVSGAITLDGQPLEYGLINFRPEGHAAPGSGGMVENGKFEIPSDKGLQPGGYAVNIQAFKKTGEMVRDFPGGPERAGRIPIQINEAGQLKAKVEAGKESRFEFQLTTKSN